MDKVNIKFVKTHADAVLPTKAHDGDNCFDLYAVEDTVVPCSGSWFGDVTVGNAVVPIGITVADITKGFGFVLRPKSGLGFKAGLQPHLGEIDNGYRGDCAVKMYNFNCKNYTFKKGDKVAQIKVEKIYDTKVGWAGMAKKSKRGDAGFGSSGK
jgi:dUTP pyrophosphatase